MLLQVLNIIMGLIATLPELRKKAVVTEEFERQVEPWKASIGIAGLALGVLGLLVRMDILPPILSSLGESYPQAIPAILLGLLLASRHLEKQALLRKASLKLQPYALYLGILAIACGLGSILFGCVLPVVCRVPF